MANYRKTKKAARGQTIQADMGRDNSSYSTSDSRSMTFGGSVENLAHSLPGTSAKQDGTGHNKSNKFD